MAYWRQNELIWSERVREIAPPTKRRTPDGLISPEPTAIRDRRRIRPPAGGCSPYVAILDVYDALSHPRLYRPAHPEDEVTAILAEVRGKPYLNARIFDCFLEVKRTFQSLRRQVETEGGPSSVSSQEYHDVCGERRSRLSPVQTLLAFIITVQ